MQSIQTQLKYLLKISRPRFWMYVFGPAILGFLLSLTSQQSFQVAPSQLIALIYFTFPANLLIYGINDIFDRDTDKHNPKKGSYEAAHQQNQTKFLATIITLTNLPFLIYLAFQNSTAVIFTAAFLFFSIQYSATPIRAKSKPIIDGIFNFLYVAPALITLSLSNPEAINQSSVPLILAGTFWCMSMHAFSAIPDIEADTKAGLTTTAVLLQEKGTFAYCFLLYLTTAILTTLYTSLPLSSPLYIYPILIIYTALNSQKTFQIYKYFPYLNTLVGFLISIQLIFMLI
jgi:4-hydroxybenzoate polyprenyltransferase